MNLFLEAKYRRDVAVIELAEGLEHAASKLWVWKSLAALGWLAFVGTLIAWGGGK